jgi:hypothetical protein
MGILELCATARWSIKFLSWTKLPEWARGELQRRRGVVIASGFRFYPTRDILEHQSNYNDFLGEIKEHGYGVFITGRKLCVNYIPNAARLDKAILADPRSKSFQDLAASGGEGENLVRMVCQSTKFLAETYKIEVFWYPEAIQAAILLRDPELGIGSVHIEPMLPFSTANMRPSFTIFKTSNENTVIDIWSIFQKMLKHSYGPDYSYINAVIGEMNNGSR